MSAGFLDNLGVGQVSEKIAAVTDTVDASVSKYVAITFASISPAILIGFIILGASYLAYTYLKKKPKSDFKIFIIFGVALVALAAPSTLSEIKHGRVWMSCFFSLLYILGSPFFIKKIFQYSRVLSTQTRLVLSVIKIILFALACIVILGAVATLIFPVTSSPVQAKKLITLTILASQIYLWMFLNATLAFLWIWQKRVHTEGVLRFVSKMPGVAFGVIFSISSATTLFAEWLPLMPIQLAVANTSAFLFIIAFVLASVLYNAFSKLTEHLCQKFFSQGMIDLFPIERAVTLFLMAVSVIIVGNLLAAYKLWIGGKPLIISYIEQFVLRVVLAFTAIFALSKASSFIRAYLKEHERGVKRIGSNRRLLSISTFVQGIVPFLLKTTAFMLAFVIFGVPFQYIATTLVLAVLFLSFVGKKVLEDITQGLLHTLFGGHLAVGDLIKVGDTDGFVESMTLYNITVRTRTTGALQVIPFSDLRNFTHLDREKARVLANVFIPPHISWREFVLYAEEAVRLIQQHPIHGQYFLGAVSYEVESDAEVSTIARICFSVLPGEGRQFVLKRFFLTALRDIMDQHDLQMSPEYTLNCHGISQNSVQESKKTRKKPNHKGPAPIGLQTPPIAPSQEAMKKPSASTIDKEKETKSQKNTQNTTRKKK